MDHANPLIPNTDQVIAGAEADGLLVKRDRLLDQPDLELAPAERGYCEQPVAIGGDRRLVFGDSLFDPVLRAPQKGLREMHKRVAGRYRQGLADQAFRALDIGSG